MPSPIPTHHIVCQCNSVEHVVQFTADDTDDEQSVCYIEVQLRQHRGFWKRTWVALRYIFGYQCVYGHWDCTSLSQEEAKKLLDFLKNNTHAGKSS